LPNNKNYAPPRTSVTLAPDGGGFLHTPSVNEKKKKIQRERWVVKTVGTRKRKNLLRDKVAKAFKGLENSFGQGQLIKKLNWIPKGPQKLECRTDGVGKEGGREYRTCLSRRKTRTGPRTRPNIVN